MVANPLILKIHFFDHVIPEQKFLEQWVDTANPLVLNTSHTLYKNNYELTAYRSLLYDSERKTFTITDNLQSDDSTDPGLVACWCFILSPFISCKKIDDYLIFEHQGKSLARFQSTINFELKDCFVSFAYGTKVASKRLEALVNIVHNDPVISTVTVMH